MNWTKKHKQYALATGLTPSSECLWQWLVEQKSEGDYCEPDLREFNRWVSRWRKRQGFCQKTLKTAFNQLVEWGVIEVVKSFGTWHTFRVLLQSICSLMPSARPQKKVQHSETISDSQPSNPETASDNLLQQQQRSAPPRLPASQAEPEVVELCVNNGIPFEDYFHIAPFSIYEVKQAILYYWRTKGCFTKPNPQGWLIYCLRFEWWRSSTGTDSSVGLEQQNLDYFIGYWRDRCFEERPGARDLPSDS